MIVTFKSYGVDLVLSEKMKCLKCGHDFEAKNREPLCSTCLKLVQKPKMTTDRKKAYAMLVWFFAVAIAIEIAVHLK